MSVLLANEPRAYRDTLAVALRMLRPNTEFIVAEPEMLDAAVLRHDPRVVVCSELTDVIERRVPTWVVLYPEGDQSAMHNVNGERSMVEEIDLAGIADLIDKAEPRAHA